MSETVVKLTINLNDPLPLTEARKEELPALALEPDTTIDFSDIPALDESRHTLATLLAECDFSKPNSENEREWLEAPRVGL